MHLTNYAINKKSKNFVKGTSLEDDSASKRSIDLVMTALETEFGVDRKVLWDEIKDIINKTIISAQPELKHIYKASQSADKIGKICYQILGFDVMFDKKLKPWLIEVNSSPSYNLDTPLDRTVKMKLIEDTFRILQANLTDKKRLNLIDRLEKERRDLRKKLVTHKSRDLKDKTIKERN